MVEVLVPTNETKPLTLSLSKGEDTKCSWFDGLTMSDRVKGE